MADATAPETQLAISTESQPYFVTVDSQGERSIFENEEKAVAYAKSDEGKAAGITSYFVVPGTYYVPGTVEGFNELVPNVEVQLPMLKNAIKQKQRNAHKSMITAKDDNDAYTLDIEKPGVVVDLRESCNAAPKRVVLTQDEQLVKFLVDKQGLTKEQAQTKLAVVKAAMFA